jgi:hypothetical protein
MQSTPETTIRELDHRNSDGIDVRLLWNHQTDQVSVAVEDQRLGRSLAFDVDGADALAAFHHPYAYASNPRPPHAPAPAAHPHERRR